MIEQQQNRGVVVIWQVKIKNAKPKIHTFRKGMKVQKYANVKESLILLNGRGLKIKKVQSKAKTAASQFKNL